MITSETKKLFIFAIVLLVVAVGIVGFMIFSMFTQNSNKNPTPIPVPTNLSSEYSLLYTLTPGKSTERDVLNTSGAPISKQTIGEKTYFYYKTPSGNFQNKVLLQNSIVTYTLENIFGEYRGTFDEYQKNTAILI